MDIVHHTLIGGAGYMVAASHGEDLAGMAFLAGSVFPDLDVVFIALGKRFYLKHHQGITHSLLLSPLYALLVTSPLLWLVGLDWKVLAGALAGLWVHVALDLSNTFRIALLSPWRSARYSLDAVFFIDTVALVLTGLFYLCYGVLHLEAAAYLYPLAFIVYVIAKALLQRRVMAQRGCAFAIPSALNPLEFYVLEQREGRTTTSLYNALTGRSRNIRHHDALPDRYRELAERSTVFNELGHILRAFQITGAREHGDGLEIEALDLAVRNFGGRFGRTRMRFNAAGELTDELADI